MKSKKCPLLEECPIFQQNIFMNKKKGQTYKAAYCMAGEKNYRSCKRYRAVEISGKAIPENIFPDSSLSIDEIILISRTVSNG